MLPVTFALLSVTLRNADSTPLLPPWGANCMFTVQLPPTAMLPPQLLAGEVVNVKSPGLLPPKAIELMFRAAVAGGTPTQAGLGPLQMVIDLAMLCVPAACE